MSLMLGTRAMVLCLLAATCGASEPFTQLKEWLAAANAPPVPLELSSGALRGVQLTRAVADGEVVMEIPAACSVFADRAAEALPGLAAAILFEENAEQQQVLALTSLLLLFANGPDRQRWAPYLDMMPV